MILINLRREGEALTVWVSRVKTASFWDEVKLRERENGGMGLLPGYHSLMSGRGNVGELNINEVTASWQLTLQWFFQIASRCLCILAGLAGWLPPVGLLRQLAVKSSMGDPHVVGKAVLMLSLWFLIGDWVHHSGPGPAATSHMPQGSVWLDAGLLATGASHEAQHQRNPFPPPELGQGISSLLGYFRLKSTSISSYGLREWMCSTAAELH